MLVAFLLMALVFGVVADPLVSGPVEFNRDIRPILSDRCYFCHGPDKGHRKADLRLDTREGLLGAPGETGSVVPSKPDASELLERMLSTDPDKRMPPPKSGKDLSPAEIALVRRWIEQGAPYEGHWAFQAIKRPKPAVVAPEPIDGFVKALLAKKGLTMAGPTDRRTLLRRLSFDLTGLPPTPEEVDAFVADRSPDALAKQVDRLLSSPRHGERLAMWWLDLVRYADTVGYHGDQPVSVHPFRQYVIDSFNANVPFDRFTREQIAGDLLPGAGDREKIASGYNRLGMMSAEGGVQPKEYLAKYIAERVRNVSGVWLGVTLGCAECHDHKYDPFATREFYRMEAFFADINEKGLYGGGTDWGPSMRVPTKVQREELARIESDISKSRSEISKSDPRLTEAYRKTLEAWKILEVRKPRSIGGAKLALRGPGSILASGKNPPTDTHVMEIVAPAGGLAVLRLEALPADGLPGRGPGRASNGNFVLTEIKARKAGDAAAPLLPFKSARATFEQNGASAGNPWGRWVAEAAIDNDAKGPGWGWAIMEEAGQANAAEFTLATPVPAGTVLEVSLVQNHPNPAHTLGSYRLMGASQAVESLVRPQSQDIVTILAKEPKSRTPDEVAKFEASVARDMLDGSPVGAELRRLEKRKADIIAAAPTTLVTERVMPRTVKILARGNWMDEKGEAVTPGTPAVLGAFKPRAALADRLDLANWVVSPENPLTARVTANRIWKLLFGSGISRSLDDFGAQGDWPSHPELVDYLAGRLVDSGWDLRALIRQVVLSETYQQSSASPRAIRDADPYNRLLARQGRFRVDAEMVRDNALAVSGLLVEKIGGPSVFPYQPPGYWAYLNFPTREWSNDAGESKHRRSVYVHWQRQYLHPSLAAFDAPSREECTAERTRSNTPLQSLVLLNDPIHVEAARQLAQRAQEIKGDDAERLRQMFRWALQRQALPDENRVLASLLAGQRQHYKALPADAAALVSVGGFKPAPGIDVVELAALTGTARALLNLHETITRE
jgi:hypothetical protein